MQQGPENQFASSLSIAVLGPAAAVPLLVAGCASVNITNPGYLAVISSSKIALRINQAFQLADRAQVAGASPDVYVNSIPWRTRGLPEILRLNRVARTYFKRRLSKDR